MSPNDIKVGKTYANKGAGRTLRTVVQIASKGLIPPWFSANPRPNEPVVRYTQKGKEGLLYLCSFASWCGNEVKL